MYGPFHKKCNSNPTRQRGEQRGYSENHGASPARRVTVFSIDVAFFLKRAIQNKINRVAEETGWEA